jgi:thiol-disulfide isomerase/thioredoxin
MWGHKLVIRWTKRDYVEFSLFTWVLIFSILAATSIVQNRADELPLMAVLSLIMIPIELLVISIFQKYSAHIDEIRDLPSLLQEDFENERLLRSGKILVFFYAEWCPFCRGAFHYLNSLDPVSYKVFKVDLSDEENPIWNFLKIRRIPTLIAFDSGKEIWRKEATYMIGLRKADFKEAESTLKAKVSE